MKRVGLAVVALFLLVLAAPASAQTTYTPPTNVTTSDSTPTSGQAVTYSGSCATGDTVTVSVDGTAVGSTTCANGTFSVTVTMPTLSAGSHTVVVAGAGGTASTTTFTVGAAGGGSTGGGTLPRTGGDPFPTAQLALGLIAVGGGLVLVARKRNAATIAA